MPAEEFWPEDMSLRCAAGVENEKKCGMCLNEISCQSWATPQSLRQNTSAIARRGNGTCRA